ncbi:MAG TPA: PAS domain S-box protein [Pirellulales bacterium]
MSTDPVSNSVLHRQELLELALAATGLVITETDVARGLVYFPPAFAELWGIAAESPQPVHVLIAGIHPDDRRGVEIIRGELISQVGAKLRLDFRVVGANGQIRWVESFGGATRATDGTLRLVMAHRDVTAAQTTLNALRESEERLRLAVESGRLGVWDWNVLTDQAMAYGMEEITGIPTDSAPGGFARWQDEVVHPDDREQIVEGYKAILAGRDVFSNCHRIVRPNGEIRWIDSGGRAYRDADGRIVRMLGFCRDVTDRMLTEQRNRELTDFLNRARDAIVVQDLDGRIAFWNQGAERLFGWSSAEALGQEARAFAWRDCRPTMDELNQRLLERGEVRSDVETVVRSGETRIIDVGWTLVTDDAGKPRARLCVAADVTERRLWEKHAQRAERLASLGSLAGGVAHDINNALAPIQLAVDLLREPGPEDDRRELLDQAASCVARAAGLVRRILDFAGGEEGERAAIDPVELLAHVEVLLRRDLPKSIDLEVEVEPEIGQLLGDFGQLTQVLVNLAMNARDAMPSGGRLTLRAAPAEYETSSEFGHTGTSGVAAPGASSGSPGASRSSEAAGASVGGPQNWISLEVVDQGSGIVPADLDRIFDPFFTRKQKGRGLGLSAVQAIVQRHQGVVQVASEVGRGSTFAVRLPAYDLPVERQPQPERALEGVRVLLVEGADELRRWSQKTLEDFGCQVVTASDGASAVAAFEQHRTAIGLAVVDLLMRTEPDCSIAETLHRRAPNLPIVAAAGLADVRAESQRLGAEAFLEKPYTPQTLLRTLHQVRRRPR